MGLIEYLLFAFPPIAKHFNQDDEMVIVPPDGSIRRVIGATDGPMLMKRSFWEPVVEKWKEDYPQMFSDTDEKGTDEDSSDKNATEPET